MSKYIMRLDDAAIKMDVVKWKRMEELLDKYRVKPLVGVIPDCKDPMMDCYDEDENFWTKVKGWEKQGWIIALHGYDHVYCTEDGGMNPVNKRSEFAGLNLNLQKKKIKKGIEILKEHEIEPQVFFAPSHTFDINTIEALKSESNIRIISDTISNKPYKKYDMTFVPQQSGRVRILPFKVITFCYHPNTMNEKDFIELEKFLINRKEKFIKFPLEQVEREKSLFDKLLEKIYFFKR